MTFGILQDFVVLLYFCAHLDFVDFKRRQWDIIDFFAGSCKVSRMASVLGYQSAAYDINLCPRKKKRRSIWRPSPAPMDVNSDAGFTCHS